jgi:hypothetical protein
MTRRDFNILADMIATDPVLYKVRASIAQRLVQHCPRFNSRLFFERVKWTQEQAAIGQKARQEGGESETKG